MADNPPMSEQPHLDAPDGPGGPPPPPASPSTARPPAGAVFATVGPPAFNRRAMLLASAFGRTLRRATWAGAAVAAACSIAVALLLGTPFLDSVARTAGLADSVMGWLEGALVVGLLAGIAGGAVGTPVAMLAMGNRDRRAYESFSWLGRREVARFIERTGGPVPTGADTAARWIAEHPPTRPFALARIELLASLGRFDEARAELDRLPSPGSDAEAGEQASLRRHVRYIATGVLDDSEVGAVLARLDPGSEWAQELRVAMACGETRRRLDLGVGDWRAPLVEVRPGLRGAFAVTVRDTWRRMFSTLFLLSAAAALIVAAAR